MSDYDLAPPSAEERHRLEAALLDARTALLDVSHVAAPRAVRGDGPAVGVGVNDPAAGQPGFAILADCY